MNLVDGPHPVSGFIRSLGRLIHAPPPVPELHTRTSGDRATLSAGQKVDERVLRLLGEALQSTSASHRIAALGVLKEWAGSRREAEPLLVHVRHLLQAGSSVEKAEAVACLAEWEDAGGMGSRAEAERASHARDSAMAPEQPDALCGLHPHSPLPAFLPAPPWWAWIVPRRDGGEMSREASRIAVNLGWVLLFLFLAWTLA